MEVEEAKQPLVRSRDEDWADAAAGRVVPNEEQFNRKKEARCESRLAAGIIWSEKSSSAVTKYWGDDAFGSATAFSGYLIRTWHSSGRRIAYIVGAASQWGGCASSRVRSRMRNYPVCEAYPTPD